MCVYVCMYVCVCVGVTGCMYAIDGSVSKCIHYNIHM